MGHLQRISPLTEPALAGALSALAIDAASAIMRTRRSGPNMRAKPDASPVTDADEAAETIILKGLGRILPGVTVVSEERGATSQSLQPVFVLVDPLDGTREFIAGRNEFTVNIAVVVGGEPVLGIVAAPALGLLWRGVKDRGAERLSFASGALETPVTIRARSWPQTRPLAMLSRSHLDPATQALLARIPGIVSEPCGSALKFCRLAEGAADFYPRLAPTREWDVGAGHALLAAAGGAVLMPDGKALAFGRAEANFLVPAFMALGDVRAASRLMIEA